MYRDLLDHEAQISGHPMVRSLAQGRLVADVRAGNPDVPPPEDLDDAQDPADTLSILDADASQRQCVEAAKRGRSFVMQGPPGTGKSQTIANVIAEAIGQGKRILFVSEKAAALDVVHKRLAASGLDEYCLMLHGEHAGRREVVHALDHSLTTSLQARAGMRSDELERLANLRTLLNDSAELLHLPQPLLGGRTLRAVHAELAMLHGAPSVGGAPPPSQLRGESVLDDYQATVEVMQRLAERWHVSAEDFVWCGYDAERFTADARGRVLAILRELRQGIESLAAVAAAVAAPIGWPAPGSLADAGRLADLGDHLLRAPALEPHWLDLEAGELRAAIDAGQNTYEQLEQRTNDFKAAFPARAIDDFAPDCDARLQAARDDVQRSCGWTSAWAHRLGDLGAATRSLDALPALIETAAQRSATTASLLGQPSVSPNQGRIYDLVEL